VPPATDNSVHSAVKKGLHAITKDNRDQIRKLLEEAMEETL
jgi:hypothetical protein